MSLYKVGDTAYIDDAEVIVDGVHTHPMIPCYRYTFEPPHDGFACACNILSATPGGPKHRLSEDYVDDDMDEADFEESVDQAVNSHLNALAAGMGGIIEEEALGAHVFFKPSIGFCDWLTKYADGRMILDVGCGQGHLIDMLKRAGAKVMGLEPQFDPMKHMAATLFRGRDWNPNEILPWTVKRAENFIQQSGDNLLLVFARPSHSGFVEEGLDVMVSGQEALYITVPENLDKYNDLGEYRDQAVLLQHGGTSEDNEVVYSVTKE